MEKKLHSVTDTLWNMKYREALKLRPSSFKHYDRRYPCNTSVEREEDSPERATVSLSFILVKISITQVSCTWHFFSRFINTNGICVSLTGDTSFHQGILLHAIINFKASLFLFVLIFINKLSKWWLFPFWVVCFYCKSKAGLDHTDDCVIGG